MSEDSNREVDGQPSQYYSVDDENQYGEGNLTPFSADYGPNIYSNPPSGPVGEKKFPHLLQEEGYTPLNRTLQVVAPLNNTTYPRDGRKKWLVNLDTAQLYTVNISDEYGGERRNWKFGKNYSTPTSGEPCFDKYNEYDGVYSAPVPVFGAPVEYRKIFFQASEVNEYGRIVGGCKGYYAYFPCTRPVLQDCVSTRQLRRDVS